MAEISLDDVNAAILRRLYDSICRAESTAELVELTEAVAKLNTSFKNNDSLGMNADIAASSKMADREQLEVLRKLGEPNPQEGEVVR